MSYEAGYMMGYQDATEDAQGASKLAWGPGWNHEPYDGAYGVEEYYFFSGSDYVAHVELNPDSGVWEWYVERNLEDDTDSWVDGTAASKDEAIAAADAAMNITG